MFCFGLYNFLLCVWKSKKMLSFSVTTNASFLILFLYGMKFLSIFSNSTNREFSSGVFYYKDCRVSLIPTGFFPLPPFPPSPPPRLPSWGGPGCPERTKVKGLWKQQGEAQRQGITIIHTDTRDWGGAGASGSGSGGRVSWEGRGGFRWGFSHSLLSPQAWVFVRCELGGGGIRAELAEGKVCLACIWGPGPPQPGKEGGLLQHHPTPTCWSQDRFQGKRPKE